MDFEELLARGGGVVSLRRLSAEGLDRAAQRRLVAEAGLELIRPGWYRQAGAHAAIVRAVMAGGSSTCIDALSLRGAWRPHGSLPVHARFARARDATAGVLAHVAPGPRQPVLDPLDSAELAARCLPRCALGDQAVAVLDSALRRGVISVADLSAALRSAGKAGERLARQVDPSAESGTESMLRMLLRRATIRFRTQMKVWGVGRVDFLIGDRLVLEADGLEFHTGEQVQRDRDRDNALERLGFHVLRFTYADIVRDPERVMATIRAVMARREHRWTARNCTWRREGRPDPVVGAEVPPVVETWAVASERFQNGQYGARNAYGEVSAA